MSDSSGDTPKPLPVGEATEAKTPSSSDGRATVVRVLLPSRALATLRWIRERLASRWFPHSFADLVQLATLVSVFFLYRQLRENTTTNQVAVRDQLYATENGLFEEERSEGLSALWALLPAEIESAEYARTLLALVSSDSAVRRASAPEALFQAMMGAESFASPRRREATEPVRRLFLFVQSNVYHVHNAFDYRQDGVIREAEWETWNGLIAEMNSHPVLLMTIWHGHTNRYFSRKFGLFLRESICSDARRGPAVQSRNCEFAHQFYPEMFTESWPDRLPDY